MKPLISAAFLIFATCNSVSASNAVFMDGLDDLSNWSVAAQSDTVTEIVDYSVLGIAEAPNKVEGSGATTGVQFKANLSSGVASAANLIGAVAGENSALTFPVFELQFDMWLNTSDPLPASGSTEQGLWGIGRTSSVALGRNNRLTDGDGTFGWLAVENGYNREDTGVFTGVFEQDRKDGSTHTSLFNSAFERTVVQPGANTANAAANQWVHVSVRANHGLVEVAYNDQLFFSISNASTEGHVMIGYEDPFESIGSVPAEQYGIIDNVIIVVPVPEPSVLSLSLLAMALPCFSRALIR